MRHQFRESCIQPTTLDVDVEETAARPDEHLEFWAEICVVAGRMSNDQLANELEKHRFD